MYFTSDIGHCLVDCFKDGYYCGDNYKACTMGQFTVLWCTETSLRQYIIGNKKSNSPADN